MMRFRQEIRQFWIVLGRFSILFWKFLAIGALFSGVILVLSVFQTGKKAVYLHIFSVGPIVIMGLVGLIRVATLIFAYYSKRVGD
jgi:hypothetical protein